MVGQMEVPASNVVHGAGYPTTGPSNGPNGDTFVNREGSKEEDPLFHQVYELCEIIGKGPFSLVR